MSQLVFTPWALPFFLGALMAGLVALYTWRQRQRYPSAAMLCCLMIDVLLWFLAYALEIMSTDPVTMERWEALVTIAQAMVGPIWLIFAAKHTGLADWLTSSKTLLVLSPGIMTVLLVLTNPWHRLLWQEVVLYTSPFSMVSPEPGPWFWALAVYRYIYILIGTTLVLVPLVRSPALYKTQGIMVALGGLLPLIGNALHIFDLMHVMSLDLGPFAFLAGGILLCLGLFTFHMVELLPLAQNAIFESMREGVIVLDNDGKLADINPAARYMLGLNRRLSAFKLTLPEILSPSLAQAISGNTDGREDYPVEHDGTQLWIKPTSHPLLDKQEQVIGRLLVLYDVTEGHKLDELREDLVQMMVHDMRNPLTIVQGSAELLAEDTLDASASTRKLVEMIQASNTQCLELVNKILDVQLLESGKLTLEKQPIQLHDLVQTTIMPLRSLATANQQTLDLAVPATLPPLSADPQLLQRILQNLIGNAIKFTPANGHIAIRAQRIDQMIQLCVSDDGPGIAADLSERLFEKFATGEHHQRGSGLGLAFCRLAVQAHGGKIWAESKQGQGSTFCFTLPLEGNFGD